MKEIRESFKRMNDNMKSLCSIDGSDDYWNHYSSFARTLIEIDDLVSRSIQFQIEEEILKNERS